MDYNTFAILAVLVVVTFLFLLVLMARDDDTPLDSRTNHHSAYSGSRDWSDYDG